MGTARALFIVGLLWALIYLPGLGSTEIKGEEGRRILPAITMLESGNWIVPSVGGEPYLRKPPLVNWLIALSFKITGSRGEFAARLPSVLSVLALAMVILLVGGGWLGTERALVAAIFTITSIGLIEKGRLAEIEAIYISLTGIAIVCWLSWWVQGKSPYLTWLVPSFFLGLGLLAKGPLHLLFFYGIVFAVLRSASILLADGDAGEADGGFRNASWKLALLGLALMLAMFAVWAVPYFKMTTDLHAAAVWTDQFAGRVKSFDLAGWLSNIPRGLSNHLPWLLFAPLLWKVDFSQFYEREIAAFKGTRLAVVACFFGLLILPAALPRYTLPLLVPASLLLAIAVQPAPRWFPLWRKINRGTAIVVVMAAVAIPFFTNSAAAKILWPVALLLTAIVFLLLKNLDAGVLAIGSGVIVASAMGIHATAIAPRMDSPARDFAQAVNRAVPPNRRLFVVAPGYQPELYYFRDGYRIVLSPKELPAEAEFIFLSEEKFRKMRGDQARWRVLAQISDRNKKQFFVLQRGDAFQKDAPGVNGL